jgi:hypothetical protein
VSETGKWNILAEVANERTRQDDLWGEQNHPDGTSKVFARERDLYRIVTDVAASTGDVTFFDILREEFYEAAAETNPLTLRAELIQLAAVAVAFVESIDRRVTGGQPVRKWKTPMESYPDTAGRRL